MQQFAGKSVRPSLDCALKHLPDILECSQPYRIRRMYKLINWGCYGSTKQLKATTDRRLLDCREVQLIGYRLSTFFTRLQQVM